MINGRCRPCPVNGIGFNIAVPPSENASFKMLVVNNPNHREQYFKNIAQGLRDYFQKNQHLMTVERMKSFCREIENMEQRIISDNFYKTKQIKSKWKT